MPIGGYVTTPTLKTEDVREVRNLVKTALEQWPKSSTQTPAVKKVRQLLESPLTNIVQAGIFRKKLKELLPVLAQEAVESTGRIDSYRLLDAAMIELSGKPNLTNIRMLKKILEAGKGIQHSCETPPIIDFGVKVFEALEKMRSTARAR
jgi:hypothetical protein